MQIKPTFAATNHLVLFARFGTFLSYQKVQTITLIMQKLPA